MKNGFSQYRTEFWEIEYPADWVVKEHAECVSFYAEDGFGAFQVSDYSKDEAVTLDDLKSFAAEEVPKGDRIKHTAVGNCAGLEAEFQYEDHFWRMWFLAKGKRFLYLTYNCDLEDFDAEREVVNQITDSFRCLDRE